VFDGDITARAMSKIAILQCALGLPPFITAILSQLFVSSCVSSSLTVPVRDVNLREACAAPRASYGIETCLRVPVVRYFHFRSCLLRFPSCV
jgi:hypothetical protein